jgi:IS5 family transposase
LTEAMFAEVGALLAERGLMLRRGTIVDATIIEAPTSTKNAEQARDPEMSQTKKRNTWHFGMKVHVGAQAHGLPLVHSVAVGTGAENELGRLGELLHGEERELFGDRGYWSKEDRRLCTQAGIAYRVQQRGRATQPLTERQRQRNRRLASIRAPVEHPFHVIKRLWGFAKVRYRGLYSTGTRCASTRYSRWRTCISRDDDCWLTGASRCSAGEERLRKQALRPNGPRQSILKPDSASLCPSPVLLWSLFQTFLRHHEPRARALAVLRGCITSSPR